MACYKNKRKRQIARYKKKWRMNVWKIEKKQIAMVVDKHSRTEFYRGNRIAYH